MVTRNKGKKQRRLKSRKHTEKVKEDGREGITTA